MHRTINELALKGTATVGAVSRDGVVLASYTRVAIGSLVVHDVDDLLVVTILGAVADRQRTGDISKVNSGNCRQLNANRKRQVLADC